MKKRKLIGVVSLFVSMFLLASCDGMSFNDFFGGDSTSTVETKIPTSKVDDSQTPSTSVNGNSSTSTGDENQTPSTSNGYTIPSTSNGYTTPSTSENQGQGGSSTSTREGQVTPSTSNNSGTTTPNSGTSSGVSQTTSIQPITQTTGTTQAGESVVLTLVDRGTTIYQGTAPIGSEIPNFPTASQMNISYTGYKLVGWRLGDKVYSFTDKYTMQTSTTFYAEWELNNSTEDKSTVRFYDGTNLLEELEYDKNEVIGIPLASKYHLSKQGYTFAGWLLGTTVYDENDDFNLVEDLYEFYAKWEDSSSPTNDSKGLDIYLNYLGKNGITLRSESFYNSVEDTTYYRGDLLPAWKTYREKLGNIALRDASLYTSSTDNNSFLDLFTTGFMSQTDENQYIDIFSNSTKNISSMAQQGMVVDLMEYINSGAMPNYKAFLDANPTIKAQLLKDGNGGIYYIPYFDGSNAIERMFLMDTSMVKKILDEDTDASLKDTATNQGGENNTTGNGITTPLNNNFFKPFIGTDEYNYSADTTVKISVNATLQSITIKKTTNIIAEQNKLLATGTSGKILRKQLRDYLLAAYDGNVGAGKVYENLSDIFVSESASYNTDDLIALMRVIKASSELLTGSADNEIEIIVPRSTQKNRLINVLQFAKIFGIQGLTSEKDLLYFDSNGKINDATLTKQTYEALDYLSQLFAEGLVLPEFYNTSLYGTGSNMLQNRYFRHVDNQVIGYGFMMFDYSQTQSINNDIDEHGFGTNPNVRTGGFDAVENTGFMPVLSPLTYWVTEQYNESNYNVLEASISDRTYKTLIRYEESNRAMQSYATCIPVFSDNITKAVALMDYLYSNEGMMINSFGPSQYWKNGEIDSNHYYNEIVPEFSDEFWNMYMGTSTDILDFLRGYIGASYYISYRAYTLNYYITNHYGQIGQKNLDNSIVSGATILSTHNASGSLAFSRTLPTIGYDSIDILTQQTYAAITKFFDNDKQGETALGWVEYIISKNTIGLDDSDVIGTYDGDGTLHEYTLSDVYDQMDERLSNYLYVMASSIGDQYIPDYAKQ